MTTTPLSERLATALVELEDAASFYDGDKAADLRAAARAWTRVADEADGDPERTALRATIAALQASIATAEQRAADLASEVARMARQATNDASDCALAAVASVVRPLLARPVQTCPQCDAPEVHCAGCGTATSTAWECADCSAGGDDGREADRLRDAVVEAAILWWHADVSDPYITRLRDAVVALDAHLAGKAFDSCDRARRAAEAEVRIALERDRDAQAERLAAFESCDRARRAAEAEVARLAGVAREACDLAESFADDAREYGPVPPRIAALRASIPTTDPAAFVAAVDRYGAAEYDIGLYAANPQRHREAVESRAALLALGGVK